MQKNRGKYFFLAGIRCKSKSKRKRIEENIFEVSFWQDSGVVGIRKVLTKVVNKGLGFVKQQSKTKRYLPSDRNF